MVHSYLRYVRANAGHLLHPPHHKVLLTNAQVLRQFAKICRKAGFNVESHRESLVVKIGAVHYLYFSLDHLNYIKFFSTLVGARYRFSVPGTIFNLIKAIDRFKLLPRGDFENLTHCVTYYRRSRRMAFSGDGSLFCFVLYGFTHGGKVILRRSDGRIQEFSKGSFETLFTRKPTYLKTKQLKLPL